MIYEENIKLKEDCADLVGYSYVVGFSYLNCLKASFLEHLN